MSEHEEQQREGDEETYEAEHPEGAPHVEPGPGGYEGRDPKTDMPRVPSAPEAEDEPQKAEREQE